MTRRAWSTDRGLLAATLLLAALAAADVATRRTSGPHPRLHRASA
jgi:hypothetical protein